MFLYEVMEPSVQGGVTKGQPVEHGKQWDWMPIVAITIVTLTMWTLESHQVLMLLG